MTSPKTVKRLQRILGMLPYVIANPGAEIDDVMGRFGYAREAELVDDLNLIFMCGLPGYGPGDLIDADIEEGAVWVDMADYFSAPSQFSPREALVLLASGMALMSSGQAPEALGDAVTKLSAALFPDAETPLLVDLDAEPEAVRTLRTAIAGTHPVDLVYVKISTGESTTRVVEPWTVFSTLGNWYVVGHCRLAQGRRVFRVDRIREMEVLEETFDMPDELPEPVVSYTPNPDDVRATIELGPQAAWVAEYYPVEAQSDDVIEFFAGSPATVARLLLRLGEHAQLLEGPEVAAELADYRHRVLVRYGEA